MLIRKTEKREIIPEQSQKQPPALCRLSHFHCPKIGCVLPSASITVSALSISIVVFSCHPRAGQGRSYLRVGLAKSSFAYQSGAGEFLSQHGGLPLYGSPCTVESRPSEDLAGPIAAETSTGFPHIRGRVDSGRWSISERCGS